MTSKAITTTTLGLIIAFGIGLLALPGAQRAAAHCQVPCGIYDDTARIDRLREDAQTIGKAIDQLHQLVEGHTAQDLNQATRWINTKETHASHIITVVSEYFLTQKVKPVAPGADGYDAYLRKLADHHAVMVAAMKTKQQADPAAVDALNAAIEQLGTHYQPHEHAHTQPAGHGH
jgi:nickel superoxide dismutase